MSENPVEFIFGEKKKNILYSKKHNADIWNNQLE